MIDMTEFNRVKGIASRVQYFDEHQEGGRAGGIVWEGFIVWEDGSHREYGDAGAGIMADASWFNQNDPKEQRELLLWQRRFCEQKLEDAVKLFEQAKEDLKKRSLYSAVHGSLPPDESELKAVRRARHKVKILEKRYDEIYLLLNPEPKPLILTDEDIKAMNDHRSQAERILEALEKCEV